MGLDSESFFSRIVELNVSSIGAEQVDHRPQHVVQALLQVARAPQAQAPLVEFGQCLGFGGKLALAVLAHTGHGQMRANARQKLSRRERLDKVVVGSGLQTFNS